MFVFDISCADGLLHVHTFLIRLSHLPIPIPSYSILSDCHRYSAHHILGEMELLNRLGFLDDDKDSEHTGIGDGNGSTGRNRIRSNLFLKPHPPVILDPSPNHSGGEGEGPLRTLMPRDSSGIRNVSLPRSSNYNNNSNNNSNNSNSATNSGSARNVSPLLPTHNNNQLKTSNRNEAMSLGTLAMSLSTNEGGQSSCQQSESEPILLTKRNASNNPSLLISDVPTAAGTGGMNGSHGHETVMNVIYQRAASTSDDAHDHA